MEQREVIVGPGPNGHNPTVPTPNGAGTAVNGARSGRKVLRFKCVPSRWDDKLGVPLLTIQGKWLLERGWKAGQMVLVEADRDEIRISRVDGVEDPP